MFVKDKIIELLNKNDGKVYLYISKDSKNLDRVRIHANENVDFSKTSTKILILHPMGLGYIRGKIDGIFYDVGDTTELFILNFVELNDTIKLVKVNPETQEIIE